MRKAFPLVAMLAAALLAACSRQAPAPEPVRTVRSMVIGASAAGMDVQYAAEIRARVESRLGLRVGGKLVRRAVDVGDTVKPGQLLAQVDPADLLLGAQAAQSAVVAAQVNADQARVVAHRGHQRGAELRERLGSVGYSRMVAELGRGQVDRATQQIALRRRSRDDSRVAPDARRGAREILRVAREIVRVPVSRRPAGQQAETSELAQDVRRRAAREAMEEKTCGPDPDAQGWRAVGMGGTAAHAACARPAPAEMLDDEAALIGETERVR